MKTPHLAKRKRYLFLLLLIFGNFFCAFAQPLIYFNSQGTTNVSLRFSSISNRIEYQLDSVSTYSSPVFRRKFVSGWTDSIMGLKLNTQYFFRSRFVDLSGNPQSGWSGTIYNTASYPFGHLFNQNTSIAITNTPLYKYNHNNETFFELWYDTVPDFNSSSLKKFSGNTLYSSYKLGLIQNKKTYYLRARVVDGIESLPWKTIQVVNKFSPSIQLLVNSGCTDTSIAYYLSYANYIYDAVSFSNKTFIKRGNKLDSLTDNSFGFNLQIKDTNSIFIYSNTDIQYDSVSMSYKDTQVFRNLLSSNDQIGYLFLSMPKNSIYFTGSSCNTYIELELYSDSTLSTLLNTQTKTNGKTTTPLIFETDWDFFKKNVLRFRVIRFGYSSEWKYIYPKDFNPLISYSGVASVDTTTSNWKIHRNYVFTGKQLEVLHDVNADFNSPKLKQYIINDSIAFNLESLFGLFNYVKCRITDGTQSTNWSNTIYKPFTATPLNGISVSIVHPNGNLSVYPFGWLNGVQLQLGKDQNNLKYDIINAPNTFQDTFDFIKNETVYFRARRYTPIDTSVWSNIQSFTYKTNPDICMLPIIVYNGNRIGKDTFIIRWIERDPEASTGYHLYIAKSPYVFSIIGIIELPAGANFTTIHKKDYQVNWFFTLYPNCAHNRYYTPNAPIWYPIYPPYSVDVRSLGDESLYMFYNSTKNCLISNNTLAYTCTVFDLNGKQIICDEIDELSPVYLPTLSKGIYFARLSNQNITYTVKFIIE